MKDHAFKGSGGGGGGGGGRGGGKPRAVGGRGLGFGPAGGAPDNNKSHAPSAPLTSFHPAASQPPHTTTAKHNEALFGATLGFHFRHYLLQLASAQKNLLV